MPHPRSVNGTAGRLQALAAIADDLGADGIAFDARSIADRMTEGRFFVACLGQFKRGKSTLLNALLSETLVPTGVLPVTSAVTTIRFGDAVAVRVHFADGRTAEIEPARLDEYVTEAGNAHNHKRVTGTEIFHPHPLLRTGLCLVDTPGLGSSISATALTKRFVPHIDAALLVLGGDPPASAEELDLLDAVRVETDQLIVVINKADKLSDSDLVEVQVFTQRALMDHLGRIPDSLFVVSAKERLSLGAPTRDWTRFERALTGLGVDAKSALLQRRGEHASTRVATQLAHAIREARIALEAPTAVVEQRVEALQQWRAEAERATADLGLLMAAEQQAATRRIDAAAAEFLSRVTSRAAKEVDDAIRAAVARSLRHLHQHAISIAAQTARRLIQEESKAVEETALKAYQAATGRFVDLANAFLSRLAETEPALTDLPAIDPSSELIGRPRFYFTEMMPLTTRTPGQVVVDLVLPARQRRAGLTRRSIAYLTRLLSTNTSRVVSDLNDRLTASRKALEADIRTRLSTLIASVDSAATRALGARAAGAAAVQQERDRLDSLSTRLNSTVTEAESIPS